MSVIGLVGGHGVGKSTAVRRWAARYPRLDAYPLDDLRKQYYDNEAKVHLVHQCQLSDRVAILESAKGYSAWLKQFRPDDPVIIVVPATATLGKQWMIERRGRPLTPWWNAENLQYELIDKFLNFAAKNLDSENWRQFRIQDKTQDWQVVDDYFGSIYRRLHNQLNRSRRR